MSDIPKSCSLPFMYSPLSYLTETHSVPQLHPRNPFQNPIPEFYSRNPIPKTPFQKPVLAWNPNPHSLERGPDRLEESVLEAVPEPLPHLPHKLLPLLVAEVAAIGGVKTNITAPSGQGETNRQTDRHLKIYCRAKKNLPLKIP